jgi:hypothetical protein
LSDRALGSVVAGAVVGTVVIIAAVAYSHIRNRRQAASRIGLAPVKRRVSTRSNKGSELDGVFPGYSTPHDNSSTPGAASASVPLMSRNSFVGVSPQLTGSSGSTDPFSALHVEDDDRNDSIVTQALSVVACGSDCNVGASFLVTVQPQLLENSTETAEDGQGTDLLFSTVPLTIPVTTTTVQCSDEDKNVSVSTEDRLP